MSEDDEEGGFNQIFWEMGTKSIKIFTVLSKTGSSTMTTLVLRETQQLQNAAENLQTQVKVGLAKMEEIKETSEKVKDCEAEISINENLDFEVIVKKPFQENIPGAGNFITNCRQCHFTCHYPRAIANDAGKKGCAAIGSNGCCTKCRGKCFWNEHFNQTYRWRYRDKEKRTIKSFSEETNCKITGEKMTVQELPDNLKSKYDHLQAEVVEMMESAKCLNRLKEIALNPNPLFTPEYIDTLIEGEKSEGKEGWKKRVQFLMSMKEKAETTAKAETGEDPLQHSETDLQPGDKGQTNSDNQKQCNISKDDSETKEKQELPKQDVAEMDSAQGQNKESITENQDKADTVTDQDEAETDNRDPAEISTDTVQDKPESDSNQDQNKVCNDADPDGANAITNQDEAENTSQQDPTEVNTNTGHDEAETDGNGCDC